LLKTIFDAESEMDRVFFLILWEEHLVSAKTVDMVMIYKIKFFCDVILCWLVNSYVLEKCTASIFRIWESLKIEGAALKCQVCTC
jgi:hypothetical protein